MRSRVLLAGAIGILLFAGVLTSAASLGTLTTSLGAATSTVLSCDTDGVTIEYTHLFNTGTDEYEIDGVTVDGVDATCDGLPYSITVSAGATDVSATGVADASGTINGTLSGVLAALSVDHVAIVIG